MTAASQVRVSAAPQPRYLSGPVTDFLMLGGATLLVFPLLLTLPSSSVQDPLAWFTFWLAFGINHPHFAVSYRIFYQGFGAKISRGGHVDTTLRYRYMVAGIAAPVLLGVGILAVAISGSSEVLAYGFNVMGFFVGWHYVKQGYGMAMVDAALKRRFLPTLEKKVMLVNGYAVWAFVWAYLNHASESRDFVGVRVNFFDLAPAVLWVSGAIGIGSTVMLVAVLGRRALLRTPTAWIGISSYLISLYLWMVLVRTYPLFILVTPALHSLQYLWVVRKFQKNRHEADPAKLSWHSQYWRSVLIGAGMFFFFPLVLDVAVSLDAELWGPAPFMFMALISINIHHYFLDNVMWRRGNAEVTQHLFA